MLSPNNQLVLTSIPMDTGTLDLTTRQLQTLQNKKNLLDALEHSLGVVTSACKACNISRESFYRYIEQDPEFAASVKAMDNVALDFAEGSLHQQIKAGVPASTIFYLKTKGRSRGYIERQEITNKDETSNAITEKMAAKLVKDGHFTQLEDAKQWLANVENDVSIEGIIG